MSFCLKCGAFVGSNDRMCPECGEPVPLDVQNGPSADVFGAFDDNSVEDTQMSSPDGVVYLDLDQTESFPTVTCRYCGAAVDEGSSYCIECGKPLNDSPSGSDVDKTTVRKTVDLGPKKDESPTKKGFKFPKVSKTPKPPRTPKPPKTPGKSGGGFPVVPLAVGVAAVIAIALVGFFVVAPMLNQPKDGAKKALVQMDSQTQDENNSQRNNEEVASTTQVAVQDAKKTSASIDETEKSDQTATDNAQDAVPTQASTPRFTKATASSTLPADSDDSTYEAQNAIDENTLTAWNEGAGGDGKNEWIKLEADTPQTVNGISLMAGYPKSRDTYYKNNRPHDITIELSDGHTQKASLADLCGEWQSVSFNGSHSITSVTITINSVYAGSAWDDASFAEISFF